MIDGTVPSGAGAGSVHARRRLAVMASCRLPRMAEVTSRGISAFGETGRLWLSFAARQRSRVSPWCDAALRPRQSICSLTSNLRQPPAINPGGWMAIFCRTGLGMSRVRRWHAKMRVTSCWEDARGGTGFPVH